MGHEQEGVLVREFWPYWSKITPLYPFSQKLNKDVVKKEKSFLKVVSFYKKPPTTFLTDFYSAWTAFNYETKW